MGVGVGVDLGLGFFGQFLLLWFGTLQIEHVIIVPILANFPAFLTSCISLLLFFGVLPGICLASGGSTTEFLISSYISMFAIGLMKWEYLFRYVSFLYQPEFACDAPCSSGSLLLYHVHMGDLLIPMICNYISFHQVHQYACIPFLTLQIKHHHSIQCYTALILLHWYWIP